MTEKMLVLCVGWMSLSVTDGNIFGGKAGRVIESWLYVGQMDVSECDRWRDGHDFEKDRCR